LKTCLSDPSVAIAYFYITDKQRPGDIVRSLVRQLSVKCVTVPQALAKLYDDYQKNEQYPTTKTFLATVPQILQGFRQVHLVLDALDECTERMALLDMVGEIADWKLDNLRVLVTSRKEHDIALRLEPLISHSIDIQSNVGEDIEIYLRGTFQTDPRFTKQRCLVDMQEEIKRTLLEGANGM
jgi:hypothetical protein